MQDLIPKNQRNNILLFLLPHLPMLENIQTRKIYSNFCMGKSLKMHVPLPELKQLEGCSVFLPQ